MPVYSLGVRANSENTSDTVLWEIQAPTLANCGMLELSMSTVDVTSANQLTYTHSLKRSSPVGIAQGPWIPISDNPNDALALSRIATQWSVLPGTGSQSLRRISDKHGGMIFLWNWPKPLLVSAASGIIIQTQTSSPTSFMETPRMVTCVVVE